MEISIFLLVLVSELFLNINAASIESQNFYKTAATKSKDMCRLDGVSFPQLDPSLLVFQCSNVCRKLDTCRFFCLDQSMRACDFFSSFVSIYWPGDSDGLQYAACYTSWGDPRNIVTPASQVSSSTENGAGYTLDLSTNGHQCKGVGYFSTMNYANSWWKFDMLAPKKVKKIIIAVPIHGQFKSVDILLGNSSSCSNPIFTKPANGVEKYISRTFVPQAGADNVGRYLCIFNRVLSYLSLGEVQVILE